MEGTETQAGTRNILYYILFRYPAPPIVFTLKNDVILLVVYLIGSYS